MPAENLTKRQKAIVRNADWFSAHQHESGPIDLPADEFYGRHGDATLNGHSATVRMMAWTLTGEAAYRQSAEATLDWLVAHQDTDGGWKQHSSFTLDGAQCVFEGLNAYQTLTGDRRYEGALIRAARRMVRGTLSSDGRLLVPELIEVGEYAFLALLAWKATGEDEFYAAAQRIVEHLTENFDPTQGYWRPFDPAHIRTGIIAGAVRPVVRWAARVLPLKGPLIAKLSEHLAGYAVVDGYPQYSMSLMDAEALLAAHDGSCSFPTLHAQTEAAVGWAEVYCPGPFAGSLVESRSVPPSRAVFPLPIINDSTLAALWPASCLLLAYCALKDTKYRKKTVETVDWILSMQDRQGGFYNFQHPGGDYLPIQSGNVNFYACLALWVFEEVFENGPLLYTSYRHTV